MASLAERLEEERLVVTIDEDSAPRILFHGEDFLLADLPLGTRVVYPPAPIDGVPNPKAAIRWALNHPHEMDPLHALLSPGMKVTIAIDDISMPLPQMRTPDVRQLILEIVLEQLADAGVDDVEMVIALCLHRRMSAAEVKRMVGEKIFDAYWPDRLYNHDAEDWDNQVTLGHTGRGEVVMLPRRVVDSDLVIYVNVNLVPMNGGHKSVSVGLGNYKTIAAHHNPQTILECDSYMDPESSALASGCKRAGKLIDEQVKVFHIETALNNRMFDGQMDFLMKNEDHFTDFDRLKFKAVQAALKKMPRKMKREMFHRIPAAYDLIAVHAGATEPTHDAILEASFKQYSVPLKGQSDVVITGIPFISPYNVNSILNPLLVQVLAHGYFHNLYRGKPVLKKGGVHIITHPCYDEFDPEHHPSYIEFFHRLLPETRDSHTLMNKYQDEFATNPTYVQMYREGNAYHGAHPFYMWYWGENGRAHTGKVIAVGAESPHVTDILGWDRADSIPEAISMAKSYLGRNPEVTMLHLPPIFMPDVE
jgi:lactate racemase